MKYPLHLSIREGKAFIIDSNGNTVTDVDNFKVGYLEEIVKRVNEYEELKNYKEQLEGFVDSLFTEIDARDMRIEKLKKENKILNEIIEGQQLSEEEYLDQLSYRDRDIRDLETLNRELRQLLRECYTQLNCWHGVEDKLQNRIMKVLNKEVK